MATDKYDLHTIDYSVQGWDAILATDMEKLDDIIHTRIGATAGESISKYDAVYLDFYGKYNQALADGTQQPTRGLAIESAELNDSFRIQRVGPMTNVSWTWATKGAEVYLSDSVPGGLTDSKPASNAQLVGFVLSATSIFIWGLASSVDKVQIGLGNVEDLKVKLDGTAAPTVNDDLYAGYSVGSRWIDVTNDKEYVCLDSTPGAAVWTETTGAAAGLNNVVEDTTPQLGGDLETLEYEILLNSSPGSNLTASGLKAVFTNGNAGSVAFGDVCYMAADGDLEFADADAASTMPALYMALGTIAAAASGQWLKLGFARNDGWSWTKGPGEAGLIYVSLTGTTGNTLTQTKPSVAGDQVQIIGHAITATIIDFNPCPVLVEIA